MPTERLFVAVPVSPAVKAELARLAEPVPGVRWTDAAQIHLTMRFLGDVETGAAERLTDKLAGVRVEPFLLPVEGVGTFPPRPPPRVLWAGLGRAHPRLFQLRQRIDDAVLAAGLDPDMRSFHAHITIGRCQESAAAAVAQWTKRHAGFTAPDFRADAFELFASVLRPGGPEHTLLRRFPLA